MRLAALRPLLLSLSLSLVASSCADTPPARTSFSPLVYDYLNPIGLNVASVDTDIRATPEINVAAPIDPVAALQQMGRDRLKAYGTSGRAVFVVTQVTLLQRAGGYEGTFGVELDVYTSTNTRSGYAEARVYRRLETDGSDVRGALYDLEKQLMDAMNVELEFQVRRSLKAWVAAAPAAAVPTPVEQQALPPPPGTAASPAAPGAAPSASPDGSGVLVPPATGSALAPLGMQPEPAAGAEGALRPTLNLAPPPPLPPPGAPQPLVPAPAY